jgi:hypothetical protein
MGNVTFTVGTSQPPLSNSIARCFGFVASSNWTSFKYLGLPIFLKRALSRDWLPQLEKFKNKMQAWGFSWLNIAGKDSAHQSSAQQPPFISILCPSSSCWHPQEDGGLH